MKRRIPYLLSALLLSGVMAALLRTVDFSARNETLSAFLSACESAVPAASPSLRPRVAQAEPISPRAVPPAAPLKMNRLKATPLGELRIRAARDGHDYGWVQLPRGTRVELVRDEGATLLVRFDQVTFRVDRTAVETGLVIPVPEPAKIARL